MGGGGSKTNEQVKVISKPSTETLVHQPSLTQPVAKVKEVVPPTGPNFAQTQSSERSQQPMNKPIMGNGGSSVQVQQPVQQPGMMQPSPHVQPQKVQQMQQQKPQDPYEKLAQRSKEMQQMESKGLSNSPGHTQLPLSGQNLGIGAPPGIGKPVQPPVNSDINQLREKRPPKGGRESQRRADENMNPVGLQLQAPHNPPIAATSMGLVGMNPVQPQEKQGGLFARQGTNSMPQISFQVNVATVEYKPKRNQGMGMAYTAMDYPSFQATGPGTLPSTGMIGSIGINNNNDRGDEINLDELQRYIGGGGRGF